MNTIIILTVLVVIFALTFDFINGFHDTANAIATSVSTRALPPRTAIIMAATMNFIGAITFVGVAKALTKDIVDPFALNAFEGDTTGSVVILGRINFSYNLEFIDMVFRYSVKFFTHIDWVYCRCRNRIRWF